MTCQAIPCVVCHQLAHHLGEDCRELARQADVPDDERRRCPVKAVHLGMTCRRCYDRMRTQLREIPELYALAAGEMLPGSGSGGGRGSSDTSLGLRISALDLRRASDVIGVLGSWAREWSEFYDEPTVDWTRRSRHGSDPVGATVVGLCGSITTGLHRACQTHPAIDDFARELADLHGAAKAGARVNGARSVQVDCPADSPTSGICGAPLRIAGLELDDVVYCRGCSTRWDVHRLLLVTASDATATVWLPVDDVALLLGVSQSTLKRWAQAKRIRREHGLLDLESVRDAIRNGTTRRLA